VNLIGLNRQFDQLPLVLMDKLMNNLLESLFHRSTKKSTPLVRAKEQMRDKKVDTVSILAESAEEHEVRHSHVVELPEEDGPERRAS
jgi:hypothetical protein